jgi:hypothetical protein
MRRACFSALVRGRGRRPVGTEHDAHDGFLGTSDEDHLCAWRGVEVNVEQCLAALAIDEKLVKPC